MFRHNLPPAHYFFFFSDWSGSFLLALEKYILLPILPGSELANFDHDFGALPTELSVDHHWWGGGTLTVPRTPQGAVALVKVSFMGSGTDDNTTTPQYETDDGLSPEETGISGFESEA